MLDISHIWLQLHVQNPDRPILLDVANVASLQLSSSSSSLYFGLARPTTLDARHLLGLCAVFADLKSFQVR